MTAATTTAAAKFPTPSGADAKTDSVVGELINGDPPVQCNLATKPSSAINETPNARGGGGGADIFSYTSSYTPSSPSDAPSGELLSCAPSSRSSFGGQMTSNRHGPAGSAASLSTSASSTATSSSSPQYFESSSSSTASTKTSSPSEPLPVVDSSAGATSGAAQAGRNIRTSSAVKDNLNSAGAAPHQPSLPPSSSSSSSSTTTIANVNLCPTGGSLGSNGHRLPFADGEVSRDAVTSTAGSTSSQQVVPPVAAGGGAAASRSPLPAGSQQEAELPPQYASHAAGNAAAQHPSSYRGTQRSKTNPNGETSNHDHHHHHHHHNDDDDDDRHHDDHHHHHVNEYQNIMIQNNNQNNHSLQHTTGNSSIRSPVGNSSQASAAGNSEDVNYSQSSTATPLHHPHAAPPHSGGGVAAAAGGYHQHQQQLHDPSVDYASATSGMQRTQLLHAVPQPPSFVTPHSIASSSPLTQSSPHPSFISAAGSAVTTGGPMHPHWPGAYFSPAVGPPGAPAGMFATAAGHHYVLPADHTVVPSPMGAARFFPSHGGPAVGGPVGPVGYQPIAGFATAPGELNGVSLHPRQGGHPAFSFVATVPAGTTTAGHHHTGAGMGVMGGEPHAYFMTTSPTGPIPACAAGGPAGGMAAPENLHLGQQPQHLAAHVMLHPHMATPCGSGLPPGLSGQQQLPATGGHLYYDRSPNQQLHLHPTAGGPAAAYHPLQQRHSHHQHHPHHPTEGLHNSQHARQQLLPATVASSYFIATSDASSTMSSVGGIVNPDITICGSTDRNSVCAIGDQNTTSVSESVGGGGGGGGAVAGGMSVQYAAPPAGGGGGMIGGKGGIDVADKGSTSWTSSSDPAAATSAGHRHDGLVAAASGAAGGGHHAQQLSGAHFSSSATPASSSSAADSNISSSRGGGGGGGDGSGSGGGGRAPQGSGGPGSGGGGAFGSVSRDSLVYGALVSVRSLNGEVYQGEVFAVDFGPFESLVLKEYDATTTANVGNFRFISLKAIIGMEVVSLPSPSAAMAAAAPPPAVDLTALEEREKRALKEFEGTRHTVGIGVTKEAQEIFDFIYRTHPDCRWAADGNTILVLGVSVPPPYEVCIGEDNNTLRRLQQVLDKVRERRRKSNLAAAAICINRTSAPTTAFPPHPTAGIGAAPQPPTAAARILFNSQAATTASGTSSSSATAANPASPFVPSAPIAPSYAAAGHNAVKPSPSAAMVNNTAFHHQAPITAATAVEQQANLSSSSSSTATISASAAPVPRKQPAGTGSLAASMATQPASPSPVSESYYTPQSAGSPRPPPSDSRSSASATIMGSVVIAGGAAGGGHQGSASSNVAGTGTHVASGAAAAPSAAALVAAAAAHGQSGGGGGGCVVFPHSHGGK